MRLTRFSFKREALWILIPVLLILLGVGLFYLVRWLIR